MPKLFFPLLLIALLVVVWFGFPETGTAGPEWASYEPPLWILGPIQGADGSEDTVNRNLNKLQENNIPITVFHFDAPDWMSCTGNAQFGYSDDLLQRMRDAGIRGLFWLVPLIADHCPEYDIALANDYFVRNPDGDVIVTSNFVGKGSWIDFDNPAAKAYWLSLLDNLRADVGTVLGGFYTDSVRPNPWGTQKYAEAYAQVLLDYTRQHIPDGDVIMKRYAPNKPGKGWTPSKGWLKRNAHAAYVNDLPTDFGGLKTGIKRVFRTSKIMPLAMNEYSGYANTAPDAETYIRRMHFGAFQPIMENVPKIEVQPWSDRYKDTPQVMQSFQYYSTLHWELAPFFNSYDWQAFETQTPILFQFNANKYSTRVGNEFFVQFVTDYVDSIKVSLPAGRWINYWNESQVFKGPSTINLSVPLGREPIFIAEGAIIPMQVRNNTTGHGTDKSVGSLTVNVYPAGTSIFRYHDPQHDWLTFTSQRVNNRLSLCTTEATPSVPVLYRIGRWTKKNNQVKVQDGAVGVNVSWGTALPAFNSEKAVAQSDGGWFYDSNKQRLIIKLTALGANCPAP